MLFRQRGLRYALSAAIACSAAMRPVRADELASYLEQHGLTSLLAVHLEEQLASLSGEQREALIRRLADLYAQLLERETDAARRLALEERSRQLLEQAPARSADELRLALLRASYRTAEKIAENHRLRLASDAELETSLRTFDEVVTKLLALREQMRESIITLERRHARAGASEAVSIGESLERARSLLAQCTFLAAWSLYYHDWLTDGPQRARDAEPLFAELLEADSPAPNPEDISVDLRSVESVARSILGMALCKSLTASSATAIAWLTLLTHPEAYEPLRLQTPVWEIAVFLEHGEFQQARDALGRASAQLPQIPLAWLRLVAVHALEDRQRSRHSGDLVRLSVTELATRGELQQVLDLAGRYGVEALGESGFALKYVQGVITYQQARQRHGSDDPTFDETLGSLYAQASEALRSATHEPDAARYPQAAAACGRLIAWCSYFRGNFLDASTEFEAAMSTSSGAEAADALWMSIVSLDKVAEAGRSVEVQTRLNELIDRFLAMYPRHEQAARLLLKRSLRSRDPSPDVAAELLAIAPDSDVYSAAQARAAEMLYQLFRDSNGGDRLVYAGQFLSAAVPLISDQPPADSTNAHIVRCRQVLEVALTDGVERLVAARAAFDALRALEATASESIAALRDELDCRRTQERLLAGDVDGAAAAADAVWERGNSTVWARLAVRAMFKQAHMTWKSDDTSEPQRAAAVERAARYGGRVLHEFREDVRALDRTGALGYYQAVAEASMLLWERDRNPERARAALFLFEKLLGKRPGNAAFLRSAAILYESLDQPTKALDNWRRLVAGSPAESLGWYEAKFHQISLLAKMDPRLAREVMNQHTQLNPEYGPDPWGARLKGLDQQIPEAIEASPKDLPGSEQMS